MPSQAREEEKAEASQLIGELNGDNTRLHDELDEVHALLEQLAASKAATESKLLAAEQRAESAEEKATGAATFSSSLDAELSAAVSFFLPASAHAHALSLSLCQCARLPPD